MRVVVFVGMLLLLLFAVSAVDTTSVNQITLLSVSEQGNGTFVGGSAELYLQIKPGSGAIFIESYPLSQLDTQLSTRLANEVACTYTDINCNQYDFFYTIRADAPIISGPSAGGAMALLTTATLLNLHLRDDVAMTGAIDSGGVILPVAGIPEKIQGAIDLDKKTVIVPALAFGNFSNITYADLPHDQIEVALISTIDEALLIATNYKARKKESVIVVPEFYTQTMEETALLLCDRTTSIIEEIDDDRKNESLFLTLEDYYNRSLIANAQNQFYSAASFCFSANIRGRQLVLEDLNQEVRRENFYRLVQSHAALEEQVDTYPLRTFSDLETYGIVKERLLESKDLLDDMNITNLTTVELGYAIERYYSAVAWSKFFGMPGRELVIDESSLRRACLQEIQITELRRNYLLTQLPENFVDSVSSDLTQAYTYASANDYALCVFKASQAKSQADLLLSSRSLSGESLQTVVALKYDWLEYVIARQQSENLFPILGYSYGEYAIALSEQEPFSALLFMEYAHSLGDLTKYFPPKKQFVLPVNLSEAIFFAAGFLIGMMIVYKFSYSRKNQRRPHARHGPPGKKR